MMALSAAQTIVPNVTQLCESANSAQVVARVDNPPRIRCNAGRLRRLPTSAQKIILPHISKPGPKIENHATHRLRYLDRFLLSLQRELRTFRNRSEHLFLTVDERGSVIARNLETV